MFNMTDVGQRISVFRKNAGLTQMELANKLGISYQAVSNWERGVSMPDISNLSALAEILSVSVDDIINDKKILAILTDDESDIENISLSADEFNTVSPLLPGEKNIKLIESVKPDSRVIHREDGSTVTVIQNQIGENLNIASLGLTTEEIDNYARKAYECGNTRMFGVFASHMSEETQLALALDAFENGKTGIFAILVGKVPQHLRGEMCRIAFENHNVSKFAILNGYMSNEERRKYLDMAISRGDAALSAILVGSLTNSDDKDEDD